MSDSVAGSSWYLAQVRPNQFRIAESNLDRQGIPAFVPTLEVTSRRGGRFRTERTLLFPGYLFVSFDPASLAWRTINSTHGISRLVSFGGHPRPVPSELVDGLMERCDGTGQLMAPEELKPNDKVTLLGGPFASFVATVENLAPRQRVWVLLDAMGSQRRILLDVGQIRKD